MAKASHSQAALQDPLWLSHKQSDKQSNTELPWKPDVNQDLVLEK